jgi:beta-lactam-binding protein with PASTA domain
MPRTEEQIQELVREMYTSAESNDWELKPETVRSQRGQRRVPLPDVKVLVLVAAAVILIVVGIVVANGSPSRRSTVSGPTTTATTSPTTVAVPVGVGKLLAEASQELAAAGLHVSTNSVANSQAAGLVLSQNPQAGALVSRGSTVVLTVSSGPSTVKVPNVVALVQIEAANVLGSAGLNVGTITQEASTHYPAGWIVSETPSSGTSVVPLSSVDLVVSTGP